MTIADTLRRFVVKLFFKVMGVTLSDGSFMNPIGKTFKLLNNGSEDSVLYFYQAIEALKK